MEKLEGMRINKNNNVENKRTNESDLMNPQIPNVVLKFDFYLILINSNLI